MLIQFTKYYSVLNPGNEANKPTDITTFKLINNDYSLKNIYRKSNEKQCKYLVYVYCVINDFPSPEIPELVRRKFYNLVGALSVKKLPITCTYLTILQ